ncbi:MAG: KilA-N domain-containing protein [Candidatus Nomurabacteria bacterium]|jgi:hypothetical protein|nr:KilA-N domain-containing protein [Candidatus Nomurabacteria bacterium]
MAKRSTIKVENTEIILLSDKQEDYISLTDIAKYRNANEPSQVIANWLRIYGTISYLGLWEKIHNPNFNSFNFEGIKKEAGRDYFGMSPKRWIEQTNAIGIASKSGRYGGAFAHKDIAFKFAAWLSPEFELYLITEFERLKEQEQKSLSAEWDLQRTISKINYHIHTDAIKEHIIPQVVDEGRKSFVYANEADLLNVALFGKTAAEWRTDNQNNKGNIRDKATLEQLVVLSNLESVNALLIRNGLSQSERLARLNATAIVQLRSLLEHNATKRLK